MASFDFVGLAQQSRGVFVHFPVCGGFFFKIRQPFHTVTFGKEIHINLAFPIVEVGEAQGFYEMRNWWKQAAQVFVVVQIEDA